jgi:hypothetical protein
LAFRALRRTLAAYACGVSTRVAVFVVSVVAALSVPASADTLAPLYAKLKLRFTVNRPGARTGWTADGALKSVPLGRQVPPQRGVDFVFPAGTRIDAGAVPACRASDQQIARTGPSACPPASRVGSGSAGLALGTIGTLDTRLSVFDGGRRLIIVFTSTAGSVVRVLSGTIEGTHVKSTIPAIVLSGGGEVAVFRLALQLRAAGTSQRPLIRTPRTCPRSGRWTFIYLPRYDSPYGVQRSTSSMRCSLH